MTAAKIPKEIYQKRRTKNHSKSREIVFDKTQKIKNPKTSEFVSK